MIIQKHIIGFALTIGVLGCGMVFYPAAGLSDAQADQLWARADALMQRHQEREAIPLLMQAAQRGQARAQTTLGNLYHEGRVLPQDDGQAMTWYAQAAAQGHRFAQYSLGNGYMLGLGGLLPDQTRATALFEESARKGLSDAQEAIAVSYELGRGTARNRQTAIAWLDRAAAQRNVNAQAMAKILRNPNTPVFQNTGEIQNFVTAIMSYCMRDRWPVRRPDLDSPGVQAWQHKTASYRDTYC